MGDQAAKVEQITNAVKDLTDQDPALKEFCHALTLQVNPSHDKRVEGVHAKSRMR